MLSTTNRYRQRSHERGFSLIEMIIAMAVFAIIIAAIAVSFGGAKKSVNANEAKATGNAYMQAVAQYQADNSNRNPPVFAQGGPLNLLGRPYLKSVPDPVTNGRVGFSHGANCSGTAVGGAGSQVGWVSVCYGAAPDYFVRVASRKDTSAATWTVCYLGVTASTPKC